MRLTSKTAILGGVALMTLAACGPDFQQGGDRQRTGQGAAIGAGIGMVFQHFKVTGVQDVCSSDLCPRRFCSALTVRP